MLRPAIDRVRHARRPLPFGDGLHGRATATGDDGARGDALHCGPARQRAAICTPPAKPAADRQSRRRSRDLAPAYTRPRLRREASARAAVRLGAAHRFPEAIAATSRKRCNPPSAPGGIATMIAPAAWSWARRPSRARRSCRKGRAPCRRNALLRSRPRAHWRTRHAACRDRACCRAVSPPPSGSAKRPARR